MSDRPDTSRPAAEAAGGWFVPKNAMTEQQIAALAPQPATTTVPMPDSATPQQSGVWYIPAGAVQPPVSVSQTNGPQQSQQPQAEQPQVAGGNDAPVTDNITGMPQPPATPSPDKDAPRTGNATQAAKPLPSGAALSSEVDYSNYVPGKGFVASSEAAGAAGTTNASPVD